MSEKFPPRIWDNILKKYEDSPHDMKYKRECRRTIDGIVTDFRHEECIGIKDKNKKLIYENDLVRISGVKNFAITEALVRWGYDHWNFEFSDTSHESVNSFIEDNAVFEVVGNIHNTICPQA